MFTSQSFKPLYSILLFVFLFTLALQFVTPALADNVLNPWGSDTVKSNIQTETGLGARDPRDIAATVIRVILGFLGIIAVGLILLAGFKWMTAGGNEDKVGEAKKTLIAGIIGLFIIVAAFAIATFVLNTLINSTT